MKFLCTAPILLLFAGICWAQNETGLVEAAKQMVLVTVPEGMAEQMRAKLSNRGTSTGEVDQNIRKALDNYALCSVLGYQKQAKKQGVSDKTVLKVLAGRLQTEEAAELLHSLDRNDIQVMLTECRRSLSVELGLEIL